MNCNCFFSRAWAGASLIWAVTFAPTVGSGSGQSYRPTKHRRDRGRRFGLCRFGDSRLPGHSHAKHRFAGQEWCRCTSGYVSCPVCSPTRAGLMTGRYQQRFGHEFNPGAPLGPSKEFGMRS